ncbi:adenosylcobalamin-dependent ribonucleoside-diphosphate reductase [Candidatus Woesearchaeota archaeon]|nr:adenosylcobalamin-dependent ribonucleoside-diphosphate reductase [Candidatus Woesearchaeota archaeon]
MSLSKNAKKILAMRYLRRDIKGKVLETPEDLFRRVAHNIALADARYTYRKQIRTLEKKYHEPFYQIVYKKEFGNLIKKDSEIKKTEREFYEMMINCDFMPNSPTLFNAGRTLQQLAACFVLPVEDDMHSIFQTLHDTAMIHQSGGGTGFSFSHLRPRGDLVKSTQGRASGPVSFMKIFDAATEQIKQGGKRRGANMGILRVDHPDIEEFITAKSHEGVLKNFNISVAVTDQFMKAVKQNSSYSLINPRTSKVIGKRNARKIFRLICEEAWKNADPGVIFLDTINHYNPTPNIGKIESTNPCAEVPLFPYEACNLGSINLAHCIKKFGIIKNTQTSLENFAQNTPFLNFAKFSINNRQKGKRTGKQISKQIDFEKIRDLVWKATHFLDNVIDMSHYPLKQIEDMVYANRKIGVGVMGFADMLVQLRVPYDSEKALKIAEQVMKFVDGETKKASVSLAKKRGVFPNFNGSKYDTGKKEDRARNATRTSIAPTGTIAIIASCSSGIEPLFAVAFSHRIIETQHITEMNQFFVDLARERGFYSDTLLKEVAHYGSLEKIKNIPSDVKGVFVVAHQIAPAYHVKMQAAFQKYTDNAVSKTVNLPYAATVKEVGDIYMLAYELGCKGISLYRYGSKPGQILTLGQCPECESGTCRVGKHG